MVKENEVNTSTQEELKKLQERKRELQKELSNIEFQIRVIKLYQHNKFLHN